MTDEQKKFLEKNFPAGEYSLVQIMVRHDELTRFIDHMKKSRCNLCMMPHVKAGFDFVNPDVEGIKQ